MSHAVAAIGAGHEGPSAVPAADPFTGHLVEQLDPTP